MTKKTNASKNNSDFSGLVLLGMARRIVEGEEFSAENFCFGDNAIFSTNTFCAIRDYLIDADLLIVVDIKKSHKVYGWTKEGEEFIQDIINDPIRPSPPPEE